jgi:hypothetical protein
VDLEALDHFVEVVVTHQEEGSREEVEEAYYKLFQLELAQHYRFQV